MKIPSRHTLSNATSKAIGWIGLIWAFGSAALVDGGKTNGIVLLLVVIITSWVIILLHELGHLLAGWAVGLTVLRFQVGPIAFFTSPFRISLFEQAIGQDAGGAVQFQCSSATSRLKWAFVGIAGPALSALVALAFGVTAETISVGSVLKPALIFGAVLSGIYALTNLLPFDGSDGSLVLFGPSTTLEHPPALP
jgi:hypothetical protein